MHTLVILIYQIEELLEKALLTPKVVQEVCLWHTQLAYYNMNGSCILEDIHSPTQSHYMKLMLELTGLCYQASSYSDHDIPFQRYF